MTYWSRKTWLKSQYTLPFYFRIGQGVPPLEGLIGLLPILPEAPMTATVPQAFPFAAADGTPLQGTLWLGCGEGAKPVVTVHCATAVHSRYYARFAAWLAGQGFEVLTYDYRGIGGSRPASLRGLRADWIDWGWLDADAAMRAAEARFPGRDYYAVGHSIGGVCAILAPASHRLRRLVTVGAQFAYWPDYQRDGRLAMLLRWHLFMPLVTEVLGYFPGKRLGWLEDVPKGVVRNWSRMGKQFETILRRGRYGCASVAPALLAQQFAGVTAPLLAISTTDDPFATIAATNRFLALTPASPKQHLRLDPSLVGTPSIGHFAFFHDRFQPSLWPLVPAFLREGPGPEPRFGEILSPP